MVPGRSPGDTGLQITYFSPQQWVWGTVTQAMPFLVTETDSIPWLLLKLLRKKTLFSGEVVRNKPRVAHNNLAVKEISETEMDLTEKQLKAQEDEG